VTTVYAEFHSLGLSTSRTPEGNKSSDLQQLLDFAVSCTWRCGTEILLQIYRIS